MFTDFEVEALVQERVAEALADQRLFDERTVELRATCRQYGRHLAEDEIAEIVVLDDDEYEQAKERVARHYAKGGSVRPPGSNAPPSPREVAGCVEFCTNQGITYSRQVLERYRKAVAG